MGEGFAKRAGGGTVFFAAVLLAAAVVGALGGAGLRWVHDGGAADDAPAAAPVIVLGIADLVRAGNDAAEIRALAERLAAGGFLVLDAQAVLAAPAELYLRPEQGETP